MGDHWKPQDVHSVRVDVHPDALKTLFGEVPIVADELHFDFQKCAVGFDGAKALVSVLLHTKCLKKLYVDASFTKMKWDGAGEIGRHVPHSVTDLTLRFDGEYLAQEGTERVVQGL